MKQQRFIFILYDMPEDPETVTIHNSLKAAKECFDSQLAEMEECETAEWHEFSNGACQSVNYEAFIIRHDITHLEPDDA